MTPHTSGAADLPAIQRYKIGYQTHERGERFSTTSGIRDDDGQWVRYTDHVAALAAGQATAAQAVVPAGWKQVPVDATDDMVRATDKVNFENEDTDGTMHNVWHAMIAAAPAQPAAQQPHRSGCTAGTDEECVQRGCGTNCPAVSPPADSVREDAAESVPAVEREQERIAFKDAHRHLDMDEVPDAWGRPMFKHTHVEAGWLGWIARASHGQAPAQPTTLPAGWVPLTITHEGQYPEEVAYGPKILMDRLGKWLGKYFEFVVTPSPQAAQQAPRDAERELEMTQQFNAGRQYEAGRIAARVAAAQQAPAGATPEGWVTWWPSPSSKGHEPIYSHGPKQPDYGAELDAMLRKYPVFAAPAAPSTPEDDGEDAEELRLLRALAFSVERAIGNGVMPLDIEEAYEGYDKWSAARAAHKEGEKP